MGQGSSRESLDALDSKEKPTSAISLSPELQEAIARDFQSQILQEEWDKFRLSFLDQRSERIKKFNDTTFLLNEQHKAQAAVSAQRHAELDQSIDDLNAEFADKSLAMRYDAEVLVHRFNASDTPLDKNHDDITKDRKPLPCLGQRAHWMDCMKKYSVDPRPCNTYLDELEKCVSSTITK